MFISISVKVTINNVLHEYIYTILKLTCVVNKFTINNYTEENSVFAFIKFNAVYLCMWLYFS